MDLSGRSLAHYEVLERLGEGAVGSVYRARDAKLDREVALKILPSYRADDTEVTERFEREARAISALNHPNIATIYAFDRDAGLHFLALEYLAGGTLAAKLGEMRGRSERFSVDQVVRYGIEIASGLAHAHQRGVLHRDVKSENILFSSDGTLKVTDFGLAKMELDHGLTEEGSLLGTMAYMAPEQVQGLPGSERSDLFSFGVVLYELAVGKLPYEGLHEAALQYDILNTPPPKLRDIRHDLPAELEHLIYRTLEKDPNRRPRSMSAVVVELQGLQDRLRTASSEPIEVPQESKPVSIGDSLGHYRLEATIGEGGMGSVYRATDTRLDRTVAIKVLHPHALTNPQRKRRFMREAKTASSLNHPGIVTIHDIGEDAGRLYIAMEYVAGETLDSLIAGPRLPTRRALDVAIRAADALAAAHEAGIVHRDLKPANIIVSEGDNVKLVDFGLAKVVELGEDSDSDEDSPKTEEGVILGTVAYMSPEQAEGRLVDARSDIFSFGSVLYELFTGKRPFSGDSKMSVLAGILHRDPPPPEQIVDLPHDLAKVLTRCLRKRPERRFQHMADLRVALEDLREEFDSQAPADVAAELVRPSRHRLDWRSGLIGLAAGALFAIAFTFFTAAPRVAELKTAARASQGITLGQLTASGGLATGASWSPDGEWIAYAADTNGSLDLWRTPVAGGEPVPLTTSPADETDPAWSPDGRTIAFALSGVDRGIYLIPEAGGETIQVTEFGRRPVWSPDGLTLAFDWSGAVYTVPYGGGRPKRVLAVSGEPHLAWLPDGERLLFWNRTQGDISVLNLEDGSLQHLGLIQTGQEVAGLSLSAQRELLTYSAGAFGGNKNLWFVRFDADDARTMSPPRQLLTTTTDDGGVRFSPDGSLIAYTVRDIERHLWGVQIDRNTGLATGEARVITLRHRLNYYPSATPDGKLLVWTAQDAGQGALYYETNSDGVERKLTREWTRSIREMGASISPDGNQVSFSSTIGGSYEVWRLPSLNSVALKLTTTEPPVRDGMTAWSPNGDLIAFYSSRFGNWDLWTVNPSGGDPPSQLTDWEGNEQFAAWSPDGAALAFAADRDGNPDIWAFDTASGSFDKLIEHPSEEGPVAWSTDGRFLYFTSNRGGTFEVWMVPSEGGEPQQITSSEGRMPDSALYTRFAVTDRELIVPMENRRGEIYLLEGF